MRITPKVMKRRTVFDGTRAAILPETLPLDPTKESRIAERRARGLDLMSTRSKTSARTILTPMNSISNGAARLHALLALNHTLVTELTAASQRVLHETAI